MEFVDLGSVTIDADLIRGHAIPSIRMAETQYRNHPEAATVKKARSSPGYSRRWPDTTVETGDVIVATPGRRSSDSTRAAATLVTKAR